MKFGFPVCNYKLRHGYCMYLHINKIIHFHKRVLTPDWKNHCFSNLL